MSADAAARAERLLRWYPARWRDRYGEEFAELLIAEIDEVPRSWRRSADVAANGVVARLSVAGIGGGPIIEPVTAVATVGGVVAGGCLLGLSIWSQLVGRTARSTGGATAHLGLLGLTATLAYVAAIALVAAVPLLAPLVRAARSQARVRRPLVVASLSAAALLAGGLHLGAHWSGGRAGIADRIAGFGWAETWSVNTAWAHPAALPLMHPARLAWLLISPMALIALFSAAALIFHRLDLSARTIRLETRLAKAAVLGMAPMLIAAAPWVLTSQHSANAALRAGTLDLALLAAMAALAMIGLVSSTRRCSTVRC